MKRLFLILFMLFSLICSAQIGGRMKERKNQKRLHSHIFKNGKWKYNPTRPGKMQTYRREGKHLFKRNITPNKRLKYKYQCQINRHRANHRIRGNEVFHKRKYKRV